MDDTLAEALQGFDAAFRRLHEAVADDEQLDETLFADTDEWLSLLRHKLVPQLSGEPYLAIAVAGGTNSGKSTVFNVMLRQDASPVRATAAATCHPVFAGNAMRVQQCLDGRLMPEFTPRKLDDVEAVLTHEAPDETLFVVEVPSLPDDIVFLDTPDVDSIDMTNWTVAENIRSAGDIVIAVVTGEKYKDDKVVEFFRAARESGRIVLPLLNKAEAESNFDIPRQQLAEFREDVGLETPCFIFPHTPGIKENYDQVIQSEDGTMTLMAFLEDLDVPEVKDIVYRRSVEYFGREAGGFLAHVDSIAESMDGVVREFNNRAKEYARKYEPVPGAQIGGLLHQYVQERRGPVRRFMGATGGAVAKGVTTVGKQVRSAIMSRATLESAQTIEKADDVHTVHRQEVTRIVRDLATSYVESSRNIAEPAGHLLRDALDEIDIDKEVEDIVTKVVNAELSDEFREHAIEMLDKWWNDPSSSRRFIEAADGILAVAPAAVAVFVGVHTAGVGTAELTAVTWPLAQQLMARAFEHGFGDRIFDFLHPWQEEQREKLVESIHEHLTEPAVQKVEQYSRPLSGEIMDELRRWQRVCLQD